MHDHTCSDECAATEEHMRAMDEDADRKLAESEDEPMPTVGTCAICGQPVTFAEPYVRGSKYDPWDVIHLDMCHE